MKVFALSVFAVTVSVVSTAGLPYYDESYQQIQNYNSRISLLNELIDKLCPTSSRKKRSAEESIPEVLEVVQGHYKKLYNELVACKWSDEIASFNCTEQGFVLNVDPLSPDYPEECATATVLTQYWRQEHSGGRIYGGGPRSSGGYACDLYDIRWFRFSGDAGNRMLNRCPTTYSCGTVYPYWTDADMPEQVGVVKNVTVYGASTRSCKSYEEPLQVMRCSWSKPNDFAYSYRTTGSGSCTKAFCGME